MPQNFYERSILHKLHIQSAGKICKEQFDFRPDHSSGLELGILADQISASLNHKNTLLWFFSMLRVHLTGCGKKHSYKTTSTGNSLQLYEKLIKFFLSEWKFIKMDTKSTVFIWVPGSYYSSTLSSLYSNGIPINV